ncbi:MAG: lysylphosphatidylglycerol synthase transmembrane domain-containing protein [Aquificota bacterium]|nr:lysylphosphatidylglycerol synthase transmembrane domain-containing protein [Aquificota bacterium]
MRLKTVLGLFLTLLFLILFLIVVPLEEIVLDLSRISVLDATMSLVLYTLSQVVRAVRWRLLIGSVSLRDCFLISSANVFLNNLLPARTGELSWFYYTRKAGVSLGLSVWSFLIVRIYDLGGMACVLMLSFLYLKAPWLVIPACVLVLLLALSVPELHRLIPRKGRMVEVRTFLKENMSGGLSAVVLMLSVITFVLKFLSIYLVTSGVWGVDPVRSLVAFTGGELTTVLPVHGFGGYGTYEAGFLIPLKMTGVDLETALKAGFTAHSFLLFASAIFGLPSMLFLHTLYRRSP